MIFIQAHNEAGIDSGKFSSWVDALNVFAHHVSDAWRLSNVSVSTLQLHRGAWNLRFVESLETEGALGYHDEEGIRPEMLVGASECNKYGVSMSSCAAHEVAEALVDPHLNLSAFDGRSKFWALEVGDPVQDQSYEINGVEVSNFVKPNWANPAAKWEFDHLGTLTRPFQISKGGYSQFVDLREPSKGWQNVGAELPIVKRKRKDHR